MLWNADTVIQVIVVTVSHVLDTLLTGLQIISLIHFVGLRLPTGKTTVMHLVAREHLPEPNSQSKLQHLCGLWTLNCGNMFIILPVLCCYAASTSLLD